MAKNLSTYEADAKAAADRITAAREAGDQLTFLPDEAKAGSAAKRGEGKATSQLRKFLAAQGLRMPEDVLIQMAGMASGDDAFVTAMARTEQVLAWAEAGAVGYKASPAAPSMAQRLATFQFVFTAQLRAAEALLPYGLAKVTPDQGTTITNTIIMPGAQAAPAPADRAAEARDITPKPRRMQPPPMPHEMQQNQGLANADIDHSDAAIRTDEVSR